MQYGIYNYKEEKGQFELMSQEGDHLILKLQTMASERESL
jgi:hypothetical protein